jgi:hypothetical protein
MAKSNSISLEDRAAIEDVVLEHNWLTDHGLQVQAPDLYEENAMITGVINVVGREALREEARKLPPGLNQRHASTNLRLRPLEDGTVEATTYTVVYRHRGDGPGGTVPGAIVDCTFTFRRDADGRWRFIKRDDSRVFTSGPNDATGGPETAPR